MLTQQFIYESKKSLQCTKIIYKAKRINSTHLKMIKGFVPKIINSTGCPLQKNIL